MRAQLTTKIPLKDGRGNVTREKEVATFAGLLAKAHEEGLKRIETELLQVPAEDNHFVAIARAVVETDKGVFTGIGDASAENVNRMIEDGHRTLAKVKTTVMVSFPEIALS